MRDNKFYIGRWRSGWCSSFSDAEQGSNLVSNKNPKTFFPPCFHDIPIHKTTHTLSSLFSHLKPQTLIIRSLRCCLPGSTADRRWLARLGSTSLNRYQWRTHM